MALTVVGLRSEQGVVIKDAHHVAKSYPQFFEHLTALGAQIQFE
jgi:3-phosphoshikimate 1-carboxyvinyltransferase